MTLTAEASRTVKLPYHSDSLLSLRGIAALLVVCHHLQFGSAMAEVTGIPVLGAFSISGSYAVFIFFAISGYLMAKILDRDYGFDSFGKFYWNRAIRVLPTYYLAIVFTAATLAYPLSAQDWQILLLLDNYYFSQFPNSPLWSLATECQFYLVAPLIALLARRMKASLLILLGLGIAIRVVYWLVFMRLPQQTALMIVYEGLEANLIYFLTGWCAYTYRDRLPVISSGLGLILVGSVLAMIYLWHFNFIENTSSGLGGSAAWMVSFPLLMSAVMFLVLPGLDDRGRMLHEVSPLACTRFG
jgi:peptidoglycan/LPS O-acetylase OafA/YrhL